MKKCWNAEGRELGMDREINRRDFLNGVALTIGASLIPGSILGASPTTEYAPEKWPDYYPPALTGLRGNHNGSFEVAHSLRDAAFWQKAGAPVNTGERYDLVIVGGGLSGLSAAHFFRKHAGPNAKILILDNHDDFGGHAKRNEFRVNGKTLLGFGGTYSIDSPAPYSKVAKGLIQELGIDVQRWKQVANFKIYSSLKLSPSVFFDKETFGVDRMVRFPAQEDSGEIDMNQQTWKQFLSEAPLSEKSKHDLHEIYNEKKDYLPGLTSEQKKQKLARISYAQFLTDIAKADPQLVKFFQARPHGLYGVGVDGVPAQDAWGLGFPGFQGMNLDPSFGKGMNRDSMEYPDGGDAYFFHFPDGNASIARMLVRRLIPAAIPGSTMDDIVTARCNYAQLDQSSSPTRIRLNSTVVRVKHQGDPASAKNVEIAYVRGNKLYSVMADQCLLACWSTVIPYICPELPQKQKDDLAYEVKVPLLYNNVVISNWNCFVKAETRYAYCPGSYHSAVSLDPPVSIGNYHCAQTPADPMVLHLMRTPCSPGLPARSQHRNGREELFLTPFEDYERKIREQLARMFSPYGMDPARDIQAITVNRWAHGYAYQYNSLFDDFWLKGQETPCERARRPFGRLAIANADAGAYAYTDGAIDQAYRAIGELTRRS
jgi:spermidine dehydrogenase